jgi:hypothetical protein
LAIAANGILATPETRKSLRKPALIYFFWAGLDKKQRVTTMPSFAALSFSIGRGMRHFAQGRLG